MQTETTSWKTKNRGPPTSAHQVQPVSQAAKCRSG
jgi:hypothetical protein